MEQFSLEKYLTNPNRKVITREGRNARIICTDKKGTDFPIVVLVDFGDKEETCYYTAKGYWNSCGIESKIDLFFAPEKHEGWINIFNGVLYGTHASCGIYESKEAAEKVGNSLSGYITTIKIEWED